VQLLLNPLGDDTVEFARNTRGRITQLVVKWGAFNGTS